MPEEEELPPPQLSAHEVVRMMIKRLVEELLTAGAFRGGF